MVGWVWRITTKMHEVVTQRAVTTSWETKRRTRYHCASFWNEHGRIDGRVRPHRFGHANGSARFGRWVWRVLLWSEDITEVEWLGGGESELAGVSFLHQISESGREGRTGSEVKNHQE